MRTLNRKQIRASQWGLIAAVVSIGMSVSAITGWAAPQDPWAAQEPSEKSPRQSSEGEYVVGVPEPLTYTLGPDDVIEITVRQHPEFSGSYTVGRDGKIQYRLVGDVPVGGLTKGELASKLAGLLGKYLTEPQVDVVITEFRSKVIYVVGEVGKPGRYYLQGENVPVREVIFQAGLPTLASSMRRTRIIHPPATEGKKKGEVVVEGLNLYALIYLGDVSKNVSLHSGDVLYVPSTVFHKASRILDPILDPVYKAAVARKIAE